MTLNCGVVNQSKAIKTDVKSTGFEGIVLGTNLGNCPAVVVGEEDILGEYGGDKDGKDEARSRQHRFGGRGRF